MPQAAELDLLFDKAAEPASALNLLLQAESASVGGDTLTRKTGARPTQAAIIGAALNVGSRIESWLGKTNPPTRATCEALCVAAFLLADEIRSEYPHAARWLDQIGPMLGALEASPPHAPQPQPSEKSEAEPEQTAVPVPPAAPAQMAVPAPPAAPAQMAVPVPPAASAHMAVPAPAVAPAQMAMPAHLPLSVPIFGPALKSLPNQAPLAPAKAAAKKKKATKADARIRWQDLLPQHHATVGRQARLATAIKTSQQTGQWPDAAQLPAWADAYLDAVQAGSHAAVVMHRDILTGAIEAASERGHDKTRIEALWRRLALQATPQQADAVWALLDHVQTTLLRLQPPAAVGLLLAMPPPLSRAAFLLAADTWLQLLPLREAPAWLGGARGEQLAAEWLRASAVSDGLLPKQAAAAKGVLAARATCARAAAIALRTWPRLPAHLHADIASLAAQSPTDYAAEGLALADSHGLWLALSSAAPALDHLSDQAARDLLAPIGMAPPTAPDDHSTQLFVTLMLRCGHFPAAVLHPARWDLMPADWLTGLSHHDFKVLLAEFVALPNVSESAAQHFARAALHFAAKTPSLWLVAAGLSVIIQADERFAEEGSTFPSFVRRQQKAIVAALDRITDDAAWIAGGGSTTPSAAVIEPGTVDRCYAFMLAFANLFQQTPTTRTTDSAYLAIFAALERAQFLLPWCAHLQQNVAGGRACVDPLTPLNMQQTAVRLCMLGPEKAVFERFARVLRTPDVRAHLLATLHNHAVLPQAIGRAGTAENFCSAQENRDRLKDVVDAIASIDNNHALHLQEFAQRPQNYLPGTPNRYSAKGARLVQTTSVLTSRLTRFVPSLVRLGLPALQIEIGCLQRAFGDDAGNEAEAVAYRPAQRLAVSKVWRHLVNIIHLMRLRSVYGALQPNEPLMHLWRSILEQLPVKSLDVFAALTKSSHENALSICSHYSSFAPLTLSDVAKTPAIDRMMADERQHHSFSAVSSHGVLSSAARPCRAPGADTAVLAFGLLTRHPLLNDQTFLQTYLMAENKQEVNVTRADLDNHRLILARAAIDEAGSQNSASFACWRALQLFVAQLVPMLADETAASSHLTLTFDFLYPTPPWKHPQALSYRQQMVQAAAFFCDLMPRTFGPERATQLKKQFVHYCTVKNVAWLTDCQTYLGNEGAESKPEVLAAARRIAENHAWTALLHDEEAAAFVPHLQRLVAMLAGADGQDNEFAGLMDAQASDMSRVLALPSRLIAAQTVTSAQAASSSWALPLKSGWQAILAEAETLLAQDAVLTSQAPWGEDL